VPAGFHSWLLADESRSHAYDLLSNLVVPRPIAFVSTRSALGEPNLAPFSFFILGGVDPPSLAFCPVHAKDGSKKATLANIEETGEFVVNLVTKDMAEGMNHTGVDYPDGSPKWGMSGFTGVPSTVVRPDRVVESPAHFECKVHQIVEHGTSSYVIGEVLVAHVSERLYDGTTGQWTRFEPIARLGGAEYLDLACGKVFEMKRPTPSPPSSVDL
jgi:flavin reductase (DIM6/NTAB) family NADH-FMN oxidoreductase RutF